MMQVYSAAFGPEDSHAVIDEHGDSFWSGELPRRLRKLLTGKHRREDVGSVAFTDSDFVVSFLDGKWEADVDEEVEAALQRSGRVDVFAFGPDASYILVGTRDTYWRDIPRKAEKLITSRRASVQMAALGYKGAYFLSFSDGHSYWGGDLSAELEGIFRERKRDIAKVFLSAYNRNYLVLFKDKSYSWSATQDMTNTLDSNGTTMDPEKIMYSTSHISSEFSDGRSIYETAEELEFGDLAAPDIPAIRVVRHHGGVYALNNRRLWAFNTAGVDAVPVIVTPLKSSELRRRLHKVDGWDVDVKDTSRHAGAKARHASAKARHAHGHHKDGHHHTHHRHRHGHDPKGKDEEAEKRHKKKRRGDKHPRRKKRSRSFFRRRHATRRAARAGSSDSGSDSDSSEASSDSDFSHSSSSSSGFSV